MRVTIPDAVRVIGSGVGRGVADPPGVRVGVGVGVTFTDAAVTTFPG